MTFAVSGDAYDRYMGRYSRLLAPRLAHFACVEPGTRALDVGCGPGALTEELARRVGAGSVLAADPSESLAAACAERVPGADVRVARAESLPWPDDSVDTALAQLVVNFLEDPPAGVREMRRVVGPGGIVAACTWDYSAGMSMLRTFWDAALALDPEAPDEGRTMRYGDPDDLAGLWRETGLEEVETAQLEVEAEYADFDDFWEPFLSGAAPGGAYCASLPHQRQAALRDECRKRLGDPDGPFSLAARAWAVRGHVS
jgi:ubiquinone/menaquinone biosynthesis C-methylase UbiE